MDPMTWISLLVVLPPVVTGNTYNEGGPRSFDFLPLIRFEQEPQVRDNFVHTKRRERNGLFAIEQRRERTVQVAVVSGAHTLCCVWELSMERETRQVGITTGSSELVYIYLYIRSLLLPLVRFPRLMTSPRVIPAYRYNALCRIGHVFLLWTTTHLMKPQLYYTGLFFFKLHLMIQLICVMTRIAHSWGRPSFSPRWFLFFTWDCINGLIVFWPLFVPGRF